MIEMIKAHIAAKASMLVMYKDEPRTINPHTTDGVLLRAYQTQPEEGWRMFKVAELTLVQFNPGPGYNPEDKGMKGTIIATVKA